jgi:hypothetical protein
MLLHMYSHGNGEVRWYLQMVPYDGAWFLLYYYYLGGYATTHALVPRSHHLLNTWFEVCLSYGHISRMPFLFEGWLVMFTYICTWI